MSNYAGVEIVALAAEIVSHLADHGIEVVVVGGLAVEIYSQNCYLTKDIDMVDVSYAKPKTLHAAMAKLGFHKKGRVFENTTTPITVEFPSAPLTTGDELITETTVIAHEFGNIPIVHARDIVKDRLSAFFHWNDNQSLVQALAVMQGHDIPALDIQAFCIKEAGVNKYYLVASLQAAVKAQAASDMKIIEQLVVDKIIAQQ
ncbi:hypothetical protein FKG94_15935 [Exilibacterium tricleocarpae]|uniref:Nucleotidyltransferase family protein n=1 Tax=Exilibacterium tricleocarpae TaxID=2591008 RepID=A0A545TBB9_9GAMM|nr:nucleotidyltransferase [Exilibacterium tricleocarpae]TQV74507.1 hypothetical protein FKG94_15935 [Exilibacterium tricleocarpae]